MGAQGVELGADGGVVGLRLRGKARRCAGRCAGKRADAREKHRGAASKNSRAGKFGRENSRSAAKRGDAREKAGGFCAGKDPSETEDTVGISASSL